MVLTGTHSFGLKAFQKEGDTPYEVSLLRAETIRERGFLVRNQRDCRWRKATRPTNPRPAQMPGPESGTDATLKLKP